MKLIRRHPLLFTAITLTVLVGVAAAIRASSDDDDRGDAVATGAPGELLTALGDAVPVPGDLRPPPPVVPGPRYEQARVRAGARITVRSAPGGAVVDKLGPRTEFGSPRALWVAERRGDWLGTPLPELSNGELGWIRYEPRVLSLYDTRYSLRADLSDRVVELRYGNRVVRRIPVTVGRPGSDTPTGDYAVTDGLVAGKLGPYYGCCALALTGHQPSLPPDWIGGDRIAIHGTPGSVGGAASLGCLRASDEDMVALFALVPLGSPVFIRA